MAKSYGYVIALVSLLYYTTASAATLSWDRNGEADMKEYAVYGCFTPGCVVTKTPSNFVASVPQVPAGQKPQYILDLTGKEGALAISARDMSLNESGLSVQVPFDSKAPAAPTNPALN